MRHSRSESDGSHQRRGPHGLQGPKILYLIERILAQDTNYGFAILEDISMDDCKDRSSEFRTRVRDGLVHGNDIGLLRRFPFQSSRGAPATLK
jgi:hypothetical protein